MSNQKRFYKCQNCTQTFLKQNRWLRQVLLSTSRIDFIFTNVRIDLQNGLNYPACIYLVWSDFSISEILQISNVTSSYPGRLHKLDKLDFSMSCHSHKLKLEIAKHLKTSTLKMMILAFLYLQSWEILHWILLYLILDESTSWTGLIFQCHVIQMN